MFHVSMLRKYTPDPAHVVDWGEIIVDTDETFEEGPVRILDNRDQVLQRKTMRLVKVLWQHRGVEEATWEHEDKCGPPILSHFRTKVRCLIFGTGINYCICMCLCVQVCMNFGDKILLRGEECKTREKFNFSEKV